jgi:hypothetical protein
VGRVVSRVQLKISAELLIHLLKLENDVSDVVTAYLDGSALVLTLEAPNAPVGAASMDPVVVRIPWNAPDTVHLKSIGWYDRDNRRVER